MNNQELEQLISDAGLGKRSAKRLRDANARRSGTSASKPRSSGHGAPHIDTSPLISL